MRAGDRAEATVLGKDPRRALRQSFRAALICRTVEVDGEVAAIGGLGGDILSDAGTLWLLTTDLIERVPVSFVREARRQVAEMQGLRPRLEGYVAADYRGALRLLEVLGFTLDAPVPIGPARALFRRFWMEA